jgi:hypothetical protein
MFNKAASVLQLIQFYNSIFYKSVKLDRLMERLKIFCSYDITRRRELYGNNNNNNNAIMYNGKNTVQIFPQLESCVSNLPGNF